MRPRTRLLVAVLSSGALAFGPSFATSAADTTLGTTFAPTVTCGDATFLQTGSVGNVSRVPTNGVITSWRYVSGTATTTPVAFKLGRVAGAGFVIVGSSAQVAVAGDTVEGKVRIPALAGDIIGLYEAGLCARSAPAGFTYSFATGDVPPGPFTIASGGTGILFDIAATLEPDADGDGFGDTSQDLCPTDKTTQAACGTGAPETTLSSLTAKKAKKATKKAAMTATFSASEASTFGCAVDSASFAACASPFTAKLKVGTHSFAVRATDTAGNLDRTAAVQTFKIKVAKKKK